MLVLVHSSPTSLERDHGRHPNLGVLSSPRRVYRAHEVNGWPWAADNDAYLAWDEGRYRDMLATIKGIFGCLFVTAPDVVGDGERTLDLFERWRPEIASTGHPVALVIQDGMTSDAIPWAEVGAIFVGGSTIWKMGDDAATIVRHAQRRGIWTHMGRVNGKRRIMYAQSIGCDSIDGSGFSAYRRQKLPWALEMCGSGRQLGLAEEVGA